MKNNALYGLLILITIGIFFIIGMMLYSETKTPEKIQIYNEIPPPARFPTHWWGYGWRPWWRRYGGVPGLGSDKPLPDHVMPPTPPKPIIVPK